MFSLGLERGRDGSSPMADLWTQRIPIQWWRWDGGVRGKPLRGFVKCWTALRGSYGFLHTHTSHGHRSHGSFSACSASTRCAPPRTIPSDPECVRVHHSAPELSMLALPCDRRTALLSVRARLAFWQNRVPYTFTTFSKLGAVWQADTVWTSFPCVDWTHRAHILIDLTFIHSFMGWINKMQRAAAATARRYHR